MQTCNKLLAFGFSILLWGPGLAAEVPVPFIEPRHADRPSPECINFSIPRFEQQRFYTLYKKLRAEDSWFLLVDHQNALPPGYIPPDLVSVGSIRLRQEVLDQMNLMIAAARKEGLNVYPVSTYRTYRYQTSLARRKLNNPYVALPGHSQHQLGTAVDFNTVDPKHEFLPEIQWLLKNAGTYGFSLSFPKGAEAEKESGYPYEPWHFRYITKEGVALQNEFFAGSQHKTLSFIHKCSVNEPSETTILALKQYMAPLANLLFPLRQELKRIENKIDFGTVKIVKYKKSKKRKSAR